MTGNLGRLLRGDVVASPALTPPGFKGPKLDHDEIDDRELGDAVDVSRELDGVAFVLVYHDIHQRETIRRVIARRVYRVRGVTYLDALCVERRAKRTFRVDRIAVAACGVTGEDLGDPEAVFVARKPAARKRAKESDPVLRAALKVLMSVARADGVVDVDEDIVLWEFIADVLPPERSGEVRYFFDIAKRLAPDFEEFSEAVAVVCRSDRNVAIMMFEALIEISAADGDHSADEVEVLQSVAGLARANGIEVVLTSGEG